MKQTLSLIFSAYFLILIFGFTDTLAFFKTPEVNALEEHSPLGFSNHSGFVDIRDLPYPQADITPSTGPLVFNDISFSCCINFNMTITAQESALIQGVKANNIPGPGITYDFTNEYNALGYPNTDDILATRIEVNHGTSAELVFQFETAPKDFDLLLIDFDNTDQLEVEIKDENGNLFPNFNNIPTSTGDIDNPNAFNPELAPTPNWFSNTGTLVSSVDGPGSRNFFVLHFRDEPVSEIKLTFEGSTPPGSRPHAYFAMYAQPSNVCSQIDYPAMVAFYDAANGQNWTNQWDLDSPMDTWHGVQLDECGRVESIYLDSNNLSGFITLEIGNLSYLRALHLVDDPITGIIPPEIGNLDSLRTLAIGLTEVTGPIPTTIGNLTELTSLTLRENNLDGNIPTEIGQLHQLTYFQVDDNNLSGSIPSQIENLSRLEFFDVSNNQLSGEIPPEFNTLTELNVLDFWDNQFTGSLPSLSNLTNLEYLAFADNQLTGIVPDFPNSPLIRLWLTVNQLDSLPPFLWEINTFGNQPDEGLQANENSFTFDDILPNLPLLEFANFTYSNQNKFFQDTVIIGYIGDNLNIDLGIDAGIDSHIGIFQNSSSNQYRWYQNGMFVDTTFTNSLAFNPLTEADEGIYEVRITNPDAPDLELCSHPITLIVQPAIETNPCAEHGYANLRFADINNPLVTTNNGSINDISWPGYANFDINYTLEGAADIKGFRSNGYSNNGNWEHLTNEDYTPLFQSFNYDNTNDIPALFVETEPGKETTTTYIFSDNPAWFDFLICDVDDSDRVSIEARDANNNLIVLNEPELGHLATAMPAAPPIWNAVQSSLTSPANAESYVNYAIFRFENQPVSSITLRFTGPEQSTCNINEDATICAHYYTSLYAKKPLEESIIENISATICQGDSVSIGTSIYTQTGNYIDTLVNSSGCDSIIHLDLTVMASLQLNIEVSPSDCNAETGSATISVPDCQEALSLEWSGGIVEDTNGDNEISLGNLPAGLHPITVSCGNCQQLDTFNVPQQSQQEEIVINTVLQDGECINISNMTFCEVGEYEFTTTGDCDTLYQINIQPALQVDINTQVAGCVGLSDGGFSLEIMGGTPPYIIEWLEMEATNSDGSFSISGLAADTYVITITDSSMPTSSLTNTVVIEEGLAFSSQINFISPDCNGEATATVWVGIFENGELVNNPEDEYEIDWNNGEFGNDTLYNVFAGAYEVIISNEEGCSYTTNIEVTQPDSVNINAIPYNALCTDVANGGIEVNLSGGTSTQGNYTIEWTNLDIEPVFTNNQTISNLESGAYNYIITDSLGCQLEGQITVGTDKQLDITSQITPPTCPEGMDGQIEISASTIDEPISPPYVFDWLNGDGIITNTDTSSIYSGLPAGTFQLILTDSDGCLLETQFVIEDPSPSFVLAMAGADTVICDEMFSLNANLPNGTTGVWQSSTDFTIINDSTIQFDNLEIGNHEATWTLSTPECPDYSSSTISINYQPEEIVIDTVLQAGECISINGMDFCEVGEYEFTNTGDCDTLYQITIQPALQIDISPQAAGCTGLSDGGFSLEILGGTPPYIIEWLEIEATSSDGSFSTMGLAADTYIITITDASMPPFSLTDTVIIADGLAISSQINFISPNCHDESTATVWVEIFENGELVNNPEGEYEIDWNNGEFGNDTLYNVLAGPYEVIINKDEGCTDTTNVEVTQPPTLTINSDIIDALCQGIADGGFVVNLSGGRPTQDNYTIEWTNLDIETEFTNAQTISNLEPGMYNYIITDSLGCQLDGSVEVGVDKYLNIETQTTPTTCPESMDGQIEIIASTIGEPISPPYFFDWLNGNGDIMNTDTSSIYSGLKADTFQLVLTDSDGCLLETQFVLEDPSPMFAFAMAGADTVICDEPFSLNADLPFETTGLWTSPNTIEFENPQAPNTSIENLQIGENLLIWTLSTEDCIDYTSDTLVIIRENPTAQTMDDFITMMEGENSIDFDVLTNDQVDSPANWEILIVEEVQDGFLTFFDSIGFTYTISSNVVADTFTYYLNHLNCPASSEIATVIIQLPDLSDLPNDVITPNDDGYNDDLYFPQLDQSPVPDNNIIIFNRWGNVVYEADPYLNDWNGVNKNGQDLPEGAYYYILDLFPDDNTIEPVKGDVTIIRKE